MTLHEQYKEDITNKLTHAYVKQSYLNSIDTIILMFKKEITIWKKEKIQFSNENPKVITRVYETEISRLSEQRELIANEKGL